MLRNLSNIKPRKSFILGSLPFPLSLASLFFLSGCGCFSDRCPVSNELTASISSEYHETADLFGTETVDEVTGKSALLFNPTVGFIIGEIRVLLDDLATDAKDLTAEMRAIVGDIEASSAQLLTQLDSTLGQRLEDTIDQLDEAERRLFADGLATITALRNTLTQIAEGGAEKIKESLWETSIVAYDAEHNLPCVERPPRIVYGNPSIKRIWRDDSAPGESENIGDDNPRLVFVKIRGNYLRFGQPTATVGGHAARVYGSNMNEFYIDLPGQVVSQLQQIHHATPVEIRATLATCNTSGPVEAAYVFTLLPPLKYRVTVRQTPTIKLPRVGRKSFKWYDRVEDCGGSRAFSNNHTLTPPTRVKNYAIRYTSGPNCNSFISGSRVAGAHAVHVTGRIGGCGKDCFLGVCNCKGRGWLGYDLSLSTLDYIPQALPTTERTTEAIQNTYTFSYLHDIPADHEDLKCDFYARVVVDDAGEESVVELNYETRIDPVTGIRASVDTSTCEIGITIPS